jgi:tetratricopeptide (TPR) repeat protein
MDAELLQIVQAGRFSDALELTRRLPPSNDPERQILIAELLERTGDLKAARRSIEKVLSAPLPPALESRALTLLGTIALEEGSTQDSVRILQASVALAAKHRCLEQQCWAELRLLTALVELSPSEASAPLVGSLRRHVNQLADPVLTCALHVFASEFEAKRGAIDTAARHARVARALIKTHQNAWIDGLTATAEFCIAFISDDLKVAHKLAQEALSTFRTTGHLRIKVASLVNLGHTHLKQGDDQKAERFLRDVLRAPGLTTRVRDSVVEGLAQLELAKGDLEACRNWIAELERSRNSALSYPKLWGCRTKTRLLGDLNAWPDALACAEEALERSTAAGDRTLRSLLLLLRAEARAHLDGSAAAGDDLVEALGGHDEPSLELLGEANRVLGRALMRDGDEIGAGEAFSRSERVLQALGHLRAARDVRQQAVAAGVRLRENCGTMVSVPPILPDGRP